mmetsp:Transcript_21401/g.29974  ORF Transcript_21401/g.29974 Transcript_21401/m.29974 type:complete len:275 (+) Transcript_21401:35-859(+)|eukprot:CAMPEP_0185260222 /NCGR_PEP_ID=MMETSP1359-20130426/8848_1 /TAXON_ID=552665 /ORGANISM="Bigelowiella longifila, Strain CCMP242" /LENGTH=274 /DNA_ID=CAMNT_0027846397 /DNA_START=23 /DNA_END=847 /DNA_ORIENTATION=-
MGLVASKCFGNRFRLQRGMHTRAVRAGASPNKSGSVYAVMVSWQVKPQCINEFIELSLMDAQGSVGKEQGCRRFDVIQDKKHPDRFAYCEIYDNEDAFQHHMTTDHFNAFKSKVGDLVVGKEKVSHCKNVYPTSPETCWNTKNDVKADNDDYFKKGSLHVIHAPKYVKPEMADQFIKEIVADAEASCEQEPGCLRFDVFQNITDPGEIYLYEVYANEDAFGYHMGTPHIKTWIEATKDMYQESREEMTIEEYQNSVTRIGRNVWPPDNAGWSVY